MLKIALGADHGGFHFKEQLKAQLSGAGYEVVDVGAAQLEADDDYPQYAAAVARLVAAESVELGILVCRSSIGMTMAANKINGVRAASCATPRQAQLAREHNHANVLSLSADELTWEQVWPVVEAFVATPVSPEERHRRRVAAIMALEANE